MTKFAKLTKIVKLISNPYFVRIACLYRIAATIEHLEAIRFCAPATLIDVGANKGQFSAAVRGLFPNVHIEAFEPLPEAAEKFDELFRGDPSARLHRLAIGTKVGTSTFYVTDRADSSSLLKPGEGQKQAYRVIVAREISVDVKPLEDVIDAASFARPVLLKIDVQGAELDVLNSIPDLAAFDFIYVELSFVELYENQSLFEEVRANLASRGFALRGVFNQSVTNAFGPTQADCLFVPFGKLRGSRVQGSQ